jgi:hypothetical protein
VIFLSDGSAGGDLPDPGFGPVSPTERRKVVLTVLAMCFAQVLSIDEVIAEIAQLPADTTAGEAWSQPPACLER